MSSIEIDQALGLFQQAAGEFKHGSMALIDKDFPSFFIIPKDSVYDKTLSTIVENECVDGTVIAMNKREVVINIGYKSEGVVSLSKPAHTSSSKVVASKVGSLQVEQSWSAPAPSCAKTVSDCPGWASRRTRP